MWQAPIKQETNKRGESGVDQAWAHIDQADGGGGHLEVALFDTAYFKKMNILFE